MTLIVQKIILFHCPLDGEQFKVLNKHLEQQLFFSCLDDYRQAGSVM